MVADTQGKEQQQQEWTRGVHSTIKLRVERLTLLYPLLLFLGSAAAWLVVWHEGKEPSFEPSILYTSLLPNTDQLLVFTNQLDANDAPHALQSTRLASSLSRRHKHVESEAQLAQCAGWPSRRLPFERGRACALRGLMPVVGLCGACKAAQANGRQDTQTHTSCEPALLIESDQR